jgi:signal transduction histidine kinase
MSTVNSHITSDGIEVRTLQELQVLIDLIKTEPDINLLPHTLMDHLVALFEPDIACYYVKESHKPYYRRSASFPDAFWQDKDIRYKFDRRSAQGGAIGKAIRTKQPVFIEDPIEAESRGEYIRFGPNVSTEIVLPIVVQEGLVPKESITALVILSRYADREFTSREFRLATIAASIISVIYNDSFAKERKEKRIEFLRDITDLQTGDPDTSFQNFLASLSKIIPSKFISLWLYNELDDTCVIRSFYPAEIRQKKISFSSLDNRILYCATSLSGHTIKSKRPTVFTQLDSKDKFSNPTFAKKHSLEWFVSVPILDSEKRPLGIVNIYPYGSHEDFDQEALNTTLTYVSPIANIIRMAELLFEESLLFTYDTFFANMLEFQDQKASWDRFASLVKDQMRCEACSIFLASADDVLYLKGSTGIAGNPPYTEVFYKPSEGLTGKAFQEAKPRIYYLELHGQHPDTHNSKLKEVLKTPGKRKSIIFVPIFDKADNPIGVIRCSNKEESPSRHVGRFNKEDILQLSKIAKVISNVHSKVSIFKERERERERNLNSLHHEILSPIDGILAHIEWMERVFERPGSADQWNLDRIRLKFSDMKQSGKLIDMLVTTMGRFNENMQLKYQDFSVVDILKTCITYLVNEARRKNVQVVLDYLGLPKIKGDRLQLMRVFYNLLRNALKYSDLNENSSYVRISASDEREDYALLFSDNGIGIIPGEEEDIFQMFKRGSNAAKVFPEGTGLGLSYCRIIMMKHGGSIRVAHLAKPTVLELRIPKNIGQSYEESSLHR